MAAIEAGAFWYIEKPLKGPVLHALLDRALDALLIADIALHRKSVGALTLEFGQRLPGVSRRQMVSKRHLGAGFGAELLRQRRRGVVLVCHYVNLP